MGHDIEQFVREKVRQSGSVYGVAKRAAVARNTVQRFLDGCGTGVGTLAKVADAVGLELLIRPKSGAECHGGAEN